MLFHSPAFIFGFLPVCFLGFVLVHRLWGWDAALLWLAGASLVFYGQWSIALAGLLLSSILFNYGAARLLLARRDDRRVARRLLLVAIGANLILLGYFKYANFLIDNVNLLTGSALSHLEILLPVGISFYTFIQIGFLVEVYNRQVGEIRFRQIGARELESRQELPRSEVRRRARRMDRAHRIEAPVLPDLERDAQRALLHDLAAVTTMGAT